MDIGVYSCRTSITTVFIDQVLVEGIRNEQNPFSMILWTVRPFRQEETTNLEAKVQGNSKRSWFLYLNVTLLAVYTLTVSPQASFWMGMGPCS